MYQKHVYYKGVFKWHLFRDIRCLDPFLKQASLHLIALLWGMEKMEKMEINMYKGKLTSK